MALGHQHVPAVAVELAKPAVTLPLVLVDLAVMGSKHWSQVLLFMLAAAAAEAGLTDLGLEATVEVGTALLWRAAINRQQKMEQKILVAVVVA